MTIKKITVTKEQARQFVMKKQLLSYARAPKNCKQCTLGIIEHLGYIQIDTINVIERAHHVVLYTRCPHYRHSDLHELQAKDRLIFEYWAHAASYVPMKDYRFYISTMRRKAAGDSWLKSWPQKHAKLMRAVKKRVEKDGPLAASDFKDERDRKRGSWWDWKPAKIALEVLFWRGDFMVKERRNFQRVYDLTERVLPSSVDVTVPSGEEEKAFFVRRALNAMGVATIQDINRYIGISGKLNTQVQCMTEANEVKEVKIKGTDKTYYALARDVRKIVSSSIKTRSRVSFLSPFDNAIILRDRTKLIFDFDYSLECYIPRPQRKYGYFCLPILWRNNLVGRIDPKADRKTGTLIVNNVHVEAVNLDYSEFIPEFTDALKQFARFHACDNIELKPNMPINLRRKVSCLL